MYLNLKQPIHRLALPHFMSLTVRQVLYKRVLWNDEFMSRAADGPTHEPSQKEGARWKYREKHFSAAELYI